MSVPTITPQLTEVLIYQGDDRTRLDELEQAVKDARVASSLPRTVGEPDREAEAIEAHNEFLAEAKERAVKIVVRTIGRKKWRQLVAEHPPRPDREADKAFGVNDETFGDALVAACLASPTFASDAEMEVFLDSLNSVQFDRLYAEAFKVNRVERESPKALSAPSRTSDAT